MIDRPPDKRDISDIARMVSAGYTLADVARFYRCAEDDVWAFVCSLKSDALLRALAENKRKKEAAAASSTRDTTPPDHK